MTFRLYIHHLQYCCYVCQGLGLDYIFNEVVFLFSANVSFRWFIFLHLYTFNY